MKQTINISSAKKSALTPYEERALLHPFMVAALPPTLMLLVVLFVTIDTRIGLIEEVNWLSSEQAKVISGVFGVAFVGGLTWFIRQVLARVFVVMFYSIGTKIRDRGKDIEEKLYSQEVGGHQKKIMPSTYYMYRKSKKLSAIELDALGGFLEDYVDNYKQPTEAEENDPKGALLAYEMHAYGSRWLAAQCRFYDDRFTETARANREYGYVRNLLGIRPILKHLYPSSVILYLSAILCLYCTDRIDPSLVVVTLFLGLLIIVFCVQIIHFDAQTENLKKRSNQYAVFLLKTPIMMRQMDEIKSIEVRAAENQAS